MDVDVDVEEGHSCCCVSYRIERRVESSRGGGLFLVGELMESQGGCCVVVR